jgi:PTH1 family peptidyl-tRNA hydrolase
VLGRWSDEEEKALPERLKIAAEIIPSFCLQGIDRTMNQYNGK